MLIIIFFANVSKKSETMFFHFSQKREREKWKNREWIIWNTAEREGAAVRILSRLASGTWRKTFWVVVGVLGGRGVGSSARHPLLPSRRLLGACS
jgi:hypothetical protein